MQSRRGGFPSRHRRDQSPASLQDMIRQFNHNKVRRRFGTHCYQLIERLHLRPWPEPISENSERDRSGPPHSMEAVHKQRARNMCPGETDGLDDLVNSRYAHTQAVVINILERQDQVRGRGFPMKAEAAGGATGRVFQRDYCTNASLVPFGLGQAGHDKVAGRKA